MEARPAAVAQQRAGLLVNGAAHGAWPSAALNLVWLAVGVAAVRKAPAQDPPVPG